MDVVVADEGVLDRKIERFRSAGVSGLRVVSDWDRTLTKAQTADGRDTTSYLVVVHGGYLGAGYRAEMDDLYARYRWVEVSHDVAEAEKRAAMHDWWAGAMLLLKRFGFTQAMLADLCGRDLMVLRSGARDLFARLDDISVPLQVLSAGLGDAIDGFLRARDLLTANVTVTANWLTFDEDGRVSGFCPPIIHTLNKGEMQGPMGSDRNCVLLLGDALEDVLMVSDSADRTVIRVGILNGDTKENRDAYLSAYDAVICDGGDLGYVNDLLDRCLG